LWLDVVGTSPGSSPVAGFGISGVEPSRSVSIILLNMDHTKKKKKKLSKVAGLNILYCVNFFVCTRSSSCALCKVWLISDQYETKLNLPYNFWCRFSFRNISEIHR
jgi:hypothetical protein